MAKTHYGYRETITESTIVEEYSEPICGTYAEDLHMTNREEFTTCEKCKKLIEKGKHIIPIESYNF